MSFQRICLLALICFSATTDIGLCRPWLCPGGPRKDQSDRKHFNQLVDRMCSQVTFAANKFGFISKAQCMSKRFCSQRLQYEFKKDRKKMCSNGGEEKGGREERRRRERGGRKEEGKEGTE